MRVIPGELRDKHYEIWQSDLESTEGEENPTLQQRLQLLSIGIQLRWQGDSFRSLRVTIRTLACFVLIGIYAQFALFRDLVILLVVWWLIKRLDFREVHSKRALKATGLHLGVSIIAFGLGIFVYMIRANNGQVPSQGLLLLVTIANAFVVASFVTAVSAALFWIADFFGTANVLVTGKIFSSLALLLLAIQWLQQFRNILDLINRSPWLSDLLIPVSRIQQITTNLVLPLVGCFVTITTVLKYHPGRIFKEKKRVWPLRGKNPSHP